MVALQFQCVLTVLTAFITLIACTDLNDPDANTCAGNLFSAPTQVHFTKAQADARNVVAIIADQVCSFALFFA